MAGGGVREGPGQGVDEAVVIDCHCLYAYKNFSPDFYVLCGRLRQFRGSDQGRIGGLLGEKPPSLGVKTFLYQYLM